MNREGTASKAEPSILEFHPFTFDTRTLLLRRRGTIVKLGPQPRKVLHLLLSRPGEVVTHDDIRQLLWGDNPNVDAESGIYSCIARLRAALSDSDGRQTYIQRVSGDTRGYCFVDDARERLRSRTAPSHPTSPPSHVRDREPESAPVLHWPSWRAVAWLVSVLALAVLAFRSAPPNRERGTLVRFMVSETILTGSPTWAAPSVAISGTGERLVFAGTNREIATPTSLLWSRRLGDTRAFPVMGTEGADNPFISPDAQWVAYFARTQLWKIPVGGGRRSFLFAGSAPRGGSWLDDEHIVFAPGTEGGLWKIRARSGAAPEPLTQIDADDGERTHRWPHVLPGGHGILFTVGNRFISTFDDADIAALDLRTGERKLVLHGGTQPSYGSGHLLFARAGALYAAPFDAERLEVTGAAFVLVEDLMTFPDSGGAQYAVSRGAALAYATGGPVARQTKLTRVDHSGDRTTLAVAPGPYQNIGLSPDGTRLALGRDGANAHLWFLEVESPSPIRLTQEWSNQLASWTPDGARITYFSARNNGFHVLTTDVTTLETETLLVSPAPTTPSGWSPSGTHLLFDQQNPHTGWDVWLLDRNDQSVEPIVQSPAAERYAVFSPDGGSIAYQSDESGRFEVYVRELKPPGLPRQVSKTAGRLPQWLRDGELTYLSDNKLMRHRLSAGGTRNDVIETWYASDTRIVDADVSTHGQQLFVLEDVDPFSHLARVVVALNWTAEAEMRAGDAAPPAYGNRP